MKNGGLTVEGVGALLREHDGNMAAVARHYGVTRQAVSQFCASRETLKAIFAECREAMKDTAESSLHRKVREGESWAVCFYLKCQAKDRGYVERTELTGPDGAPLVVPYIEVARPEKIGPIGPIGPIRPTSPVEAAPEVKPDATARGSQT